MDMEPTQQQHRRQIPKRNTTEVVQYINNDNVPSSEEITTDDESNESRYSDQIAADSSIAEPVQSLPDGTSSPALHPPAAKRKITGGLVTAAMKDRNDQLMRLLETGIGPPTVEEALANFVQSVVGMFSEHHKIAFAAKFTTFLLDTAASPEFQGYLNSYK